MVPPPGAELSVPATVEKVEELWMLHAYHAEEILIAKMAPEVIFLSEMGDTFRLEETVVEHGAAHGVQIQQHHTAVEARQAVGRGIAHTRLGLFLAILPEGVSEEEKGQIGKSQALRIIKDPVHTFTAFGRRLYPKRLKFISYN